MTATANGDILLHADGFSILTSGSFNDSEKQPGGTAEKCSFQYPNQRIVQ